MSARSAVEATPGAWILEELTFTRREAQMEAVNAYHHWRRARDRVAYGIYRAAQDRADAAQDALSDRWWAERAADTT
jgi:hypothetical protein